LHRAAYSNHLEAAKVLVQRGADKSLKDKYGRTPHAEAVKQKHHEIAAFLDAE
jgi:ankyrin repeat protein